MNNNQWIDDVMGSTKGMNKAIANPYLYQKVLTRLKEENKPVFEVGGVVVRRWALAASLVMAVNIFSVAHMVSHASKAEKEQGYSELSQEMGLTASDNI